MTLLCEWLKAVFQCLHPVYNPLPFHTCEIVYLDSAGLLRDSASGWGGLTVPCSTTDSLPGLQPYPPDF